MASAKEKARAEVARAGRQQVSEFVSENIAAIITRLWELTAATKKVYVACPHCRKRSEVEVPDTNGAVKALDSLITQGYGRPKVEGEDGGGGFVLKRTVVAPGEVAPVPPPASEV